MHILLKFANFSAAQSQTMCAANMQGRRCKGGKTHLEICKKPKDIYHITNIIYSCLCFGGSIYFSETSSFSDFALAGCLDGSQHRYAACWKNGCISPISAPHFALLSPFIPFHSSFLHCFSRGSSGKAPRFLLPGDTFATKHLPPPCGRFWSAHGRNCRSGSPLRRRIFRVTWVPPCPRCKVP